MENNIFVLYLYIMTFKCTSLCNQSSSVDDTSLIKLIDIITLFLQFYIYFALNLFLILQLTIICYTNTTRYHSNIKS